MGKLRFAFAVNKTGSFENTHFGDADKYMIFCWNGFNMKLEKELINKYKLFDEEQEHGSTKKGKAIVEYLKINDVKIIVSKQFGRNIKIVNRHFIPIIVRDDNIYDIANILCNNMKLFKDKLLCFSNVFDVYKINNGQLSN